MLLQLVESTIDPKLQCYIYKPPGVGMAVCYIGVCVKTNKAYVGKHAHGVQGKSAWATRIRNKAKQTDCVAIQGAVSKYGMSAFRWFIVWHGPESEVNERERYFISPDGYDTLCPKGYNLELGGGSGLCPESREKVNAANRTPAARKNASMKSKQQAINQKKLGQKTLHDHATDWWNSASDEQKAAASAKHSASLTPAHRLAISEKAKQTFGSTAGRIACSERRKAVIKRDRENGGFGEEIRKSKFLATVEAKHAAKMANMSPTEQEAYKKKVAAGRKDYERSRKQLLALRKIKPDAQLRDIPIARREGWLPSID